MPPPLNLIIREFDVSDLENVVALWETCELTRPWNDPRQDIKRAIENPSSTLLVGEHEEKFCATVMVGHDGHRGWIYYLAVHPGLRHNGIARAMIERAENWLVSQESVKVMLMVRKSNRSVLKFYEKLGYRESDVVTLERWLSKPGN